MSRWTAIALALVLASTADAAVIIRGARKFIFSTLAEMPSTGMADGDTAYTSDTGQYFWWSTIDGWVEIVAGGGSGAPTTATYKTQIPDAGLSAEEAFSLKADGAILNQSGTGISTIYTGAACANQFIRSLNASLVATCNSVVSADITDGTVAYADIQNVGALSVFGRSANSIGVGADISVGSDGQILRRAASVLGFGSIDLAASAAVGVSILPVANGGTGGSASALLDTLGATRGAILERGASGWQIIAPGVSGTVLTSSGSGSDPAWAVPAVPLVRTAGLPRPPCNAVRRLNWQKTNCQ